MKVEQLTMNLDQAKPEPKPKREKVAESDLFPEPEAPPEQNRDYWDSTGQIFFTGGKGYGLSQDLKTVCLGREHDILSYLAGGNMPAETSQVTIELLQKIKELKAKGDLENARSELIPVKSTSRKRAIRTRSFRTGPTSHTEYKPVNTRHFKARQRFPGG